MKRKRHKTKAADDPDVKLSPLQQAICDVGRALYKVPSVDSGMLFRQVVSYVCSYAHRPKVLKKLIKLFQEIEKKRPFTETVLRRQVRVAWLQFIVDNEGKLPTYPELTSKVCEIAKHKYTDNLSRSVYYIAKDLQLRMTNWRRRK